MLRFTSNDEPRAREALIRAYLVEAMGYAEAGVTSPKETHALEVPDALREAMAAEPELARAFQAPGRQRSYVINLKGAKKPETQIARIEKFRDKIMNGKGATER